VIDFYGAAAKTGFEVDGIAHDMGDRPERDEKRTLWIEAQGIRIVRIPAKEILADPGKVAAAIAALCRRGGYPLHRPLRGRSPSPFPLRGNGEELKKG